MRARLYVGLIAFAFAGIVMLSRSNTLRGWVGFGPSLLATAPDVEHPKRYSLHHVNFTYPGNWYIQERHQSDSVLIDVMQTRASLITIQVYTDPMIVDLDKYTDIIVSQIREYFAESVYRGATTQLSDVGDIRRQISHGLRQGRRRAFQVIRSGRTKAEVVLEIYALGLGPRTAYVSVISPADSLTEALPGFSMILDSLDVDGSR